MSDPTPRRRRSGEQRTPVTAAITQESQVPHRDNMRRRASGTQWQDRVKDYDRNGPGVAGYYLDTVSLMASLCPIFVSVRNKAGEFERSEDPVLQVALEGWRGALMTTPELSFAAVRGRESLGVVWHIRDPETGYNVTSDCRVLDEHRMAWTDLYGRQRVISKDHVWRSWIPDPYEPWVATSPMRRALPDLKRLRSVIRNQIRAADSRALTNGILSFGHDPTAGSRPFQGVAGSAQGDNQSEGVPALIEDFLDIAKLAHRDDDSPAAIAPFPMEGPPPVFTDLGRHMDPTALEAELKAIEAFARAVNFPQQLLVMGPGAANHWNEFLTQETAVKVSIAPKLQPVCNDVAQFHLRPMIEQLRRSLSTWKSVDPRHVRVEFDLSFLLRRPQVFSELFEAYRLGIIERRDVWSAMPVKGEMLAIPTGMTEYEHWELATMGKGAPYAETDLDNNLIVPQDPMAGGAAPMDPASADPAAAPQDASAMVLDALNGGSGGNAVQGPAGGGGTAAGGVPPTGGDMSVSEPSGPVTASLDDQVSADLYADAAEADKQITTELAAMLAVITAAVTAEVARRVVTAHPARSDTRRALSELPAADVWDAADPEVRASFPIEQVIAETVERYRPEIEAAYNEAAATFLDKWGSTIAAVLVTAGVLAAVDALLSGFTSWAVGRYIGPTGVLTGGSLAVRRATKSGRGDGGSARKLAVPPTGLIRSSLTIAGGGTVDRDGTLMVDQAGNPTPVGGGRWNGNTGWFTGHNVTSAAPTPPIRWQWRHGFIRRPAEPFEPHRVLDGKTFDNPSDVPGGLFPGDHPHCTCALLPVVRPG